MRFKSIIFTSKDCPVHTTRLSMMKYIYPFAVNYIVTKEKGFMRMFPTDKSKFKIEFTFITNRQICDNIILNYHAKPINFEIIDNKVKIKYEFI